MDSQDYYLEATYADGFVYKGTRKDVSSFVTGKNQFHDIEQKLFEPEHGKLVTWAVTSIEGTHYELDMTLLPDNARVILYKVFERDYKLDEEDNIIGEGTLRLMKTMFGAQWNDESGKNHQLIEELDLNKN